MGRPTTVPGATRTKRLQTMVTAEMEAEIDELRGNKSLSTWLFDVVEHAIRSFRAHPDTAAAFAEPIERDEEQ